MEVKELTLPLDIIQASCGLSLDIGGSVAKLIYRSKDDYTKGKPTNPKDGLKTGPVCLKHFSRDGKDINDVIQYIRDHVDLTEHDGKIVVNCTGIGTNYYKFKLEQDLGISMQSRLEYDYFSSSLRYLVDNLPHETVFYPPSETGIALAESVVSMFLENAAKVKEMNNDSSDDSPKPETSMTFDESLSFNIRQMASHIPRKYLPCHLVVCGSDIGVLQISESGETSLLDFNMMGGRVFLGICRMMTNGIQDYATLMHLAETGNSRNVDECQKDLSTREAGDIYSTFILDLDPVIFPFGKACYKDRGDIKDADLVASFHTVTCETIARNVLNLARLNNIHNIFFGGFFIDHHKTREAITQFLFKKIVFYGLREYHVQFLRNGGYMGAIGAFMEPL